ncbi:predicted protein [Uncinocarpus reesii 1704]|uniref:N-acetyltransferase domain-containing protein n=1 Tax=Uncinocarpus reesii (strain UAMH 1704) TaxID=336963 RepID=C4JIX4_UNCRE|nr:uncharacterized protein UREG_01581 [Uncinocarpus reesii 1704]EEP76732.1 predicted protein [Uncinocarpus reesii 1704]
MASLPSSQYQLLPAEVSDAAVIHELDTLAFGAEELAQIVFDGHNPASNSLRLEQIRNSLQDPAVTYTKVMVDGKHVAQAQWVLNLDPDWHLKGEPEEKKKARMENAANPEAYGEFFGWLYGVRKRRMGGQKHLLLASLVTHPEYQGRGIGSLLLKEGLAVADKHNIPAWLEASAAGYPLYKKFGFEDVEIFDMDLTKYGGKTVARSVAMVRQPQGKSD